MKVVNNDKTNYAQSLMHMIKGNLGTGILAMAKTFSHSGLVNAIIGLPIICFLNTYCVHLLLNSCELIRTKLAASATILPEDIEYGDFAKTAFLLGPKPVRRFANTAAYTVIGALILSQFGVCCVYLVFVVDNVKEILITQSIVVDKNVIFVVIYPIALLLSYIRTLKRLSIASACANVIQAVGIAIILEYLLRDFGGVNILHDRDLFRPTSEVAMAFSTAMFAFEGIAVVLPIYNKMKNPQDMRSACGVTNLSYFMLMILYFLIGFFGYVKFGSSSRDSITLNLPPTPLYDAVRAMFTTSIFLSYPLQFYVLNEILWSMFKAQLEYLISQQSETESNKELDEEIKEEEIEPRREKEEEYINDAESKVSIYSNQTGTSSFNSSKKSAHGPQERLSLRNLNVESNQKKATPSELAQFDQILAPNTLLQGKKTLDDRIDQETNNNTNFELSDGLINDKWEYLFRTILVTITFVLAMAVPKLNFLMDLVGSISATLLCLIIPSSVHLVTYWDEYHGTRKVFFVIFDLLCIIFGIIGAILGLSFSVMNLVESFTKTT